MHAMFITFGPFSHAVKSVYRNRSNRQFSSQSSKGWYSIKDDVYVIDTFQNVEIYNLLAKLIDIPGHYLAPTNGTKGFWDMF